MGKAKNNPISRSEVAELVAARMALNVTPSLVFEVIKELGNVVGDLVSNGDSVMLDNLGVVKPTLIKARAYNNPQRAGEAVQSPDRVGVRLRAGMPLLRKLGRR
jgi:nucleoid DNA-binding protein